jgi:hypothetical protein
MNRVFRPTVPKYIPLNKETHDSILKLNTLQHSECISARYRSFVKQV